jgi:hypothetical protein
MQFLIHGADHKTGREMTIVVDARDPADAARRVLYNDVLVSSITDFVQTPSQPEPSPAELPELQQPRGEDESAIEYKAPEVEPPQRQPCSRPPFYRQILSGARSLRTLSLAISTVGLILVVAALVAAALPWCRVLRIYLPFVVVPGLCYLAAAALAIMGVVCACCAAPLSMMSEMALAMRDLARNSFRDEIAEPPAEPAEPPARVKILRSRTTESLITCGEVNRALPAS